MIQETIVAGRPRGDSVAAVRSLYWKHITVATLFLAAVPAEGQIFDKLKDRLKDAASGASFSRLVAQDPITSSLNDVKQEVPFLDCHDPYTIRPMATLAKSPKGGWKLQPGAYSYAAQSYCLRAGTYAPSRGNGYAYAPLKGPAADQVRAILTNSARYPEIAQNDIQVLLWAIIARAKFEKLSSQERKIAALLLSPAQTATLNRSALDLLPGGSLNNALGSAPPLVQDVLRAEAEMRQLFARGASYEEMERVAMRSGEPAGTLRPMVPGTWSYLPSGYFIRYFPHGYQSTIVDVEVPAPVSIETDVQGRILSLTDRQTQRFLRISYDQTPGVPYAGSAEVQTFGMHSIHFEGPAPDKPELLRKADWEGRAPILTGVPPARPMSRVVLTPMYDVAREVTVSTNSLLATLGRRPPDAAAATMLANLVHLETALEVVLLADRKPDDRTIALLDLVMNTWQYGFCRAAGACGAVGNFRAAGRDMLPPSGPLTVGFLPQCCYANITDEELDLVPGGQILIPASACQRLGLSERIHLWLESQVRVVSIKERIANGEGEHTCWSNGKMAGTRFPAEPPVPYHP